MALLILSIPHGKGYTVWTGIGIVGTVAFGIAFFNEPVQLLRVVCIVCILIGIVGLDCIS